MALIAIFDTKQTLYNWRSAAWKYAENLDVLLPEAQKGTIVKNYRSPKQLVLLSNEVVSLFKQHGIEAKDSVAHNGVVKNALLVHQFTEQPQEIEWICNDIYNRSQKGEILSNITILARTNKMLLDFEAGMIKYKIPYLLKYDTRSIINKSPFRVMFSLYSVLFNPQDINSFCELIAPIKGIGIKTLTKLRRDWVSVLKQKPTASIFTDLGMFNLKHTKQNQSIFKFMAEILVPIQNEFATCDFDLRILNSAIKKIYFNKCSFENDEQKKMFPLNIDFAQWINVFTLVDNILYLMEDDVEYNRFSKHEKFREIYNSLQLSQENYLKNLTDKRKNKDVKRVTLSTIHSFKGMQNEIIYAACLKGHSGCHIASFEDLCTFYVTCTRSSRTLILSSSDYIMSFKGQLVPSVENQILTHYIEAIPKVKALLSK